MSKLKEKLELKVLTTFGNQMHLTVDGYRSTMFNDYLKLLADHRPCDPAPVTHLDRGLTFVEHCFDMVSIATYKIETRSEVIETLTKKLVVFRDEIIASLEIAKHFNRQIKAKENDNC